MKSKILTLIFSLSFLSPLMVLAQDEGTPVDRIIDNPLGVDSITGLLALVLDIVVQIGLVVIVFFIIFAGFQFVTAQGDRDKISKAREALVATLIGSAIVLGSYAIASALKNTVEQLREGVVTTINLPPLQG